MTIPKIKATYSLDEQTTKLLERLARRWAVSKSEALRRLIRESASAEGAVAKTAGVLSFERGQRAAGMTARAAAAWARHARAERRAAASRKP